MVNEDKYYEKQLGFSYWYVTHRILLKNILTAFLIVLDIVLIAFNLYLVILNLAILQKDYQLILTNFVSANPDYTILRQASLPPEIKVTGITTFQNDKGYDIIAEINNANPKWSATFDYQFQLGKNLSSLRKGFIMPGEKKKILDLAVTDGNLVSQIVFSNVKWEKQIDFAKLYQEKFKFDIRNIKYIPAQELGIGEKVPVSRVSFEIENLTAYNYKNINLIILLNSSGQLAAVNQIPTGTLLSGQTKSFDVNFFQRLPKIDSAEIIPDLNIFDTTIFLKF